MKGKRVFLRRGGGGKIKRDEDKKKLKTEGGPPDWGPFFYFFIFFLTFFLLFSGFLVALVCSRLICGCLKGYCLRRRSLIGNGTSTESRSTLSTQTFIDRTAYE